MDAGRPAVPDGVEVHLESDGVELLDRVRTVVKSPGVPNEAPVIEAARERGLEVVGELELAWRLLPNEFIAVTGTNGKTTTVELLGAMHRAAGIAGRGGRQRGHAALVARRLAGARRRGGVRGVELPARGHRRVRAGVRGAAEHRARPHRPARHLRGLPRREDAGVREPGPWRHRDPAAVPAAADRRGASCACAAPTTSRTRARRRRRRSPAGSRRTPWPRRCARSAACRTGWRRSPRRAA